jgi:DNA replication and repair protein RecF
MSLTSLDIKQFRNLDHVVIQPDPCLNIITGLNAAGKTSLLESIFYLSYGRSFRSSHTKDLIMFDQEYFRLVTNVENNGKESLLGIQKSSQQQTIRINKQNISKITELSTLLPVIALHPDSHQLISAGPENRRQYMDWGVFHVEHYFYQVWKDFRKALSQRNAALRNKQSDKLCCLWNPLLIENAEIIEKMRCQYLDNLNIFLALNAEKLFPENIITLEYKRGWSDDINYQAYLETSLTKDKDKGFTQSGPHRADIKIKLDGKSAQTSISRGQQKKLVALLKLAQLEFFIQSSNKTCVLIYDDLPAELDKENRKILMDMLSKMNVQLFVSAIEASQLDIESWSSVKMFHVEHGAVLEKSL